jgi:AcrR family transcriptional regulator
MFDIQATKLAHDNRGTEDRLLQAAGEIFAEYGYRAATVRQICERAGANIAAVNYHFGDKAGLYRAVLRSVPRAYAEKYPPNSGLSSRASAEQQLHAYVKSMLHRVFDEGRPGWHTKLIAREMIEPTAALDTLLEEVARPVHRELASILGEILGSGVSDDVLRRCTLSVMSQCVYYHHARTVIRRLYPEQKYDSGEIEQLAEHITQFSVAALRSLGKKQKANLDELL